MNQELEQEMNKVDKSYQERKQKQAEVWNGFYGEVAKLTEIVSREFSKVLKEIELPEKAEITDFDVDYTPQLKDFTIKIKNWGVNIDGKLHSDREGGYKYCAHTYLKPIIGFSRELNPNIERFNQDFNIRHISYECGCGSDHK
ncbi:MAG: hypothetical protein PHH54_06905 [Candidatus Nanoarchaeia archaeon]|nr:hypothetical protein [Candidatus Nanoarchaeia archaeon]MDD5741684.1 hypothetical protein [Candidatus Nanoarchaeia archaeon]